MILKQVKTAISPIIKGEKEKESGQDFVDKSDFLYAQGS